MAKPREPLTNYRVMACERDDPFWYDCARMQCHSCPERICAGGCGETAENCACDDDEEWRECVDVMSSFLRAKP